jgi:hypothetical protein
MQKEIWKYTLKTTDVQTVPLPINAKILHVGVQRERICLWAEVDPIEAAFTSHIFRIIGTGHPIFDTYQLKYLGTVMLQGGSLVFHVYIQT